MTFVVAFFIFGRTITPFPSTTTAMKILIVDDEEDILDLLEYNLEQEGYEVVRAIDGHAAIREAQKEKPDMVLLDIMMPNLDGIETCRRLRSLPGMQQAYIVFLTARGEEYSEMAGFDVGADDYITKPIKPRVLMKRIQAIFRRTSLVEAPQVLKVQGDLPGLDHPP